MTHPTLFDLSPVQVNQYGSPMSRRTDPATSKQGAKHIATKRGSLCALFVDALRKNLRPMTAAEAAIFALPVSKPSRLESLRKRAKELVAAGLIRVAGSRKCRVTGKMAQAYEAV